MTHPTWRRPSRCDSGTCVAVAFTHDTVLVSDSKLGDDSPVLTYTRDEWQQLLQLVKAGGYPVEVTPDPFSPSWWWDTDTLPLRFTEAEIDAFRAGCVAGEFDLPEVTHG